MCISYFIALGVGPRPDFVQSKNMPLMQLHENVTLVGSGELGLTHYLDCHIYLLHSRGEYALVDTGSGVHAERLLNGLPRLRYVLLTHCHGDHAGAVHLIKGAKVASSAWELQMLEQGTDEDLGLVQARYAGTYPADYTFVHAKGDLVLEHGTELTLGDLTICAVMTPGHTRGSVCYLVKTPAGTILFSGDTVFWGGLIQLLNTPGSDISEYRQSVQALAGLGVDGLFPGHGLWALRNGQAHIDKMLHYFKRSAVPPMPAFVEKIKV
jgi:glyoxylase-like metal-dependent hydrolase (beta-lactamase superfamily II)